MYSRIRFILRLVIKMSFHFVRNCYFTTTLVLCKPLFCHSSLVRGWGVSFFRYIFEVPILIKPSLLCNLFYSRLLSFVVCHIAVSMPLSTFVHNWCVVSSVAFLWERSPSEAKGRFFCACVLVCVYVCERERESTLWSSGFRISWY
jgi:hypothetical protein